MCTTKEERKRIYGTSSLLKNLDNETFNEWQKPILHEMDSQTCEMAFPWAFGKFIPCKVPNSWKDVSPHSEESFSETSDDIFDSYMGVSFLTVGNVLINIERKKCGLIKDIIHGNWDPSPLPLDDESVMDWHLRLVAECKQANKRHKEGVSDYIIFTPVTTIIMDEIILDWEDFSLDNVHGTLRISKVKMREELRQHTVLH